MSKGVLNTLESDVTSTNIGGVIDLQYTVDNNGQFKNVPPYINMRLAEIVTSDKLVQPLYLQPIITQYFIDNKSEIWLLFLIAHSKR